MSGGEDTIGSIATGALIAAEIELAHAGHPALGHDAHEPCANCGTVRQGPYCHVCGQAGHVHRNLGALVHDIAHGVFHFEGKVWHTLPLLSLKPGELTRRYVAGERARFVSPMALFLFSVFLMFAVVSNLAGHGSPTAKALAQKHNLPSAIANSRAKLAAAQADLAKAGDGDARIKATERLADRKGDLASLLALQQTHAADEGAQGEEARKTIVQGMRINTGWSRLDGMLRHTADNPELVLYKMKTYAYKYSWALIPISLPFLWLLFAFRRDVGMYDHAIFAIYSLSFMSLGVVVLTALSALGVPSGLIFFAVVIVPPLHMYRQLKGAYGLGRFGAAWRTVALLCITVVTSSLFASFLFYMGND
ncbi:DUF3667 domain-containing protein [Sphingomonas nostoxanthinifaciens]|uniref:DUF3667 domain-containing protein n=1 Tax=Sphingomonas nostoxanthinifaciens TaxID=2872652 RepID=UPI001CC217E0|nr:DUF3667 domain-containing protein [Sphingomonas nostoxanthinifaciens]UAK24562.1 DUF3667 domain-containing protein [Sphingomonas nostoxanthinifaciens]